MTTPSVIELFGRLSLELLYPPFRDKIVDVITKCHLDRRATYWATRGFSTYGEQTALWEQGRLRPGAIVTDARGGESAHNFGLAVDFAFDVLPDVPKLQPRWMAEDFIVLGEEASRAGLSWGGLYRKPDRPHVQWPGWDTAKQLKPLRERWRDTGSFQEVWDCVKCMDEIHRR